MVECGQYNKLWHDIHMLPEESAQAAVDLKADMMMPIHWAMFELSLHPWKEPVERLTVKAKQLNLPIFTPKIGVPKCLPSLIQMTVAIRKICLY